MKHTDIDFRTMLRFEPESGRVLLGTDRLVIFREEAFSTLRRLLIEELGPVRARAHLAQFGYQCGVGDHKAFNQMYAWDSEVDEIASGPVMHMWEGIVHVETESLHFDRATGDFSMRVRWTNSYEASAHLAAFGPSDLPVCHTLTGYASGWGSAFMRRPLLAIEERCVGKGDDACIGVIRRAEDFGPEADPWREALSADLALARDLQSAAAELEAQKRALSAVSTPIIQVWDSVVVVPVIGAIDARRSADMADALLRRVSADGIECVIFDVTGVESASATLIEELIRLSDATRLLGARALLTGVRAEMAESLVAAGVDTGRLTTCRTLREGLDMSLRLLGYQVTRAAARAR